MTYVKVAIACVVGATLVGLGIEWRTAREGGPPADYLEGLVFGLAVGAGMAVVVALEILGYRWRVTQRRRRRRRPA